ncbi:sigma-70 family RNA polymerase sigma factor [Acinetobacter larvae]|nr:sigma-70 family RNA polymerase sigma factor [Acinetobacter larvae]
MLERLYREHYAWLYVWLCNRLQQNSHVEDVLQDTFVKLLKSNLVEQIQHPKSYLAQTASRIIIDQARRKYIEQAYLDYLATHQQDSDCNTPENILCAIELLERLASMLEGLDAQVRQIFLLRYLDELTQLQIAARLNLSRGTVQRALIHAIQHCDAIIREQ